MVRSVAVVNRNGVTKGLLVRGDSAKPSSGKNSFETGGRGGEAREESGAGEFGLDKESVESSPDDEVSSSEYGISERSTTQIVNSPVRV